MAYTYLIGWSEFNKWYYGVRFAKNSMPNDLWVTYFTSSKEVKKFREEHGEPDIISIRKIFDNPTSARLWENKVLKRIDAKNSPKWLNKTDNIAPGNGAYYHTSEIRKKKSLSHIGLKHTEETKKKIGHAHKGVPKDSLRGRKRPEFAALISKPVRYNNEVYSGVSELQIKLHKGFYTIKKMISLGEVEYV
jgi:hypothetical protein